MKSHNQHCGTDFQNLILKFWEKFLNFFKSLLHLQLLPRDAMHSMDYAVARFLSVHPSVCLSHADVLSEQLSVSLHKGFHHQVSLPF